jgi:hypothetical protein
MRLKDLGYLAELKNKLPIGHAQKILKYALTANSVS